MSGNNAITGNNATSIQEVHFRFVTLPVVLDVSQPSVSSVLSLFFGPPVLGTEENFATRATLGMRCRHPLIDLLPLTVRCRRLWRH